MTRFSLSLVLICILHAGISFTASAQTQTCAAAWQVGLSITVGEVLSYNGHNWQALQGGYNTISGWEPSNTPALWSDLGPCSGGGGGGGGGGEAPFGGNPTAVPGTVQAESYDTGGQGVAYNVTSVNGTDNSFRSDGVDLEVTTDTGGGLDLGWTATGQWFKYTVNVTTAGVYQVTFRVAAINAVTDAFHISNSSGTNLTGNINVPATGAWQSWTNVTATVTLTAGQQTLTVNQDNAGWNLNFMTFTSGAEGPFGGTPAAVPGTAQAENYDTGGQGVAYNVTSVNGTDNIYRSDGVDLELTTDAGGGLDLGWTAAGQWFKYTVNVASAGTYTITFRVAAINAVTDAFHISNSSGTNLTGNINVPATGAWQSWTSVTATVTLAAGQQTLTVNQDHAGWNLNFMTFASGSGGGGNPPPGSNLFAPYNDMSLTVSEGIVTTVQNAGLKAITLAFLIGNGSCSFGWGGLGGTLPTDNEPNGTTIQSLVQQMQANGVTVIISFGGANGAIVNGCNNAGALQAGLQGVLSRYGVSMLDFDMEASDTLGDGPGLPVLDQALKGLKSANPNLVVSFTLPVLPTGLINSGIAVLNQAHSDGFNPDVINVMAMDYGSGVDNGGQMGLDATDAAQATHTQIQQAGLSSTVGIIPMIGQNDTSGEIFQLSDVNTVLNFANSNSYVTRLSFWSLARDNGGCPNQGSASATCSGVAQNTYQFSQSFEPF
jgi:hypothetical protein